MLNETDYRDRRIRAAVKELAHLERIRFTIRKLPEPIQRGWQRVFALTTHAESRKDREILEAILPTINTYRACRRLDFKVKVYRTRALIEIEQSLRRLTDREFEKAGSPTAWIPYFRWNHYSEWGRPRYIGEFRQPSLFELRVEPRFVWHVKEVNPEIETRIEELDKWLDWSGGWKRYAHQRGKPSSSFKGIRDARAEDLKKFHARLIKSALLDPAEVDPATSTRRCPASLCRCSYALSQPNRSCRRGIPAECNSSRNVNRTSVPGCLAKAIVRRMRMGCKLSAFRCFFTVSYSLSLPINLPPQTK